MLRDITTRKFRTAIFTISSNNYMPFTRTLISSSLNVHPDVDHFLCLADKKVGPRDFYPGNCEIIEAQELGIPDFLGFAFRYDIMEMNTAAKPYMFLKLLERGYDRIIYFDPDIKLYRTITPIFEAMDAGAKVVFTPHLTEPAETLTAPDDISIMRAGIYNLGFVAFRRSEGVEDVLRWWARRLRYQCINAQNDGIFVDQKFMDLVPGFLSDVAILRDTTLNAAYWNLSQRPLAGNAMDGWSIDGSPLTFFHFSGYDPRNSARLSKYTTMFSENNSESLLSLMRDYSDDLRRNGLHNTPRANYAYDRFDNGAKIPTFVRHYFRNTHLTWAGNPFRNFQDYLDKPALGTSEGPEGIFCTNLMRTIWESSAYLRSTYDIGSASGVAGLAEWCLSHGHHSEVDSRLTHGIAERVSNGRRWRNNIYLSTASPGKADIAVIGHLTANSAMGELGRSALKSLNTTGRRIEGFDLSSAQPSMTDAPVPSPSANGRLHIYGTTPDQLPLARETYGARLGEAAYRIAMPTWELSYFPPSLLSAFDHMDEIWAPSQFVQSALAMKTTKPVLYMPVALDCATDHSLDRASLGLPEGRFLFLCCIDLLSGIRQQNPEAVIAAFAAAFQDTRHSDQVILAIHCSNAHMRPEGLDQIRGMLDSNMEMVVLGNELSRSEILALIKAADCLVSLHRSESLGLRVAEAMTLGTPVIATDYGATTGLLTASTGYPVEYKFIDLEAEDHCLAAGQVWAEPDIAHAAWQMRQAVDEAYDNADMLESAQAQALTKHGTAPVRQILERRLHELGL